jgi:Protein of unknown function (DUF3489)
MTSKKIATTNGAADQQIHGSDAVPNPIVAEPDTGLGTGPDDAPPSGAVLVEPDGDGLPPIKKQDALIAMLRRDGGASIEELSEAFEWLPHSTRAMLTGLRKAGHTVERSKQGTVTIYKLAA